MVKEISSNVNITPIASTDSDAPAYELQCGPMVRRLNRYQRASDPDFHEAWKGLCAGTVAMGKQQFSWTECHRLDESHNVYSASIRDYKGNPLRFTVFTKVEQLGVSLAAEVTAEQVCAVQVWCHDDRINFYTNVDQDISTVQDAFSRAAKTFVKSPA